MSKKNRIGILLEYGFHEMKKFIHSGLAEELSKGFDIVWIALNKDNKQFDAYFQSTGFPVVYCKPDNFNRPFLKSEHQNRTVRNAWMLNRNIGLFHNYRKIHSRSLKTILLGNNSLKKRLERKVLSEVRDYYFSKEMYDIYEEYQLDAVLGISVSSSFAKSGIVTAKKCNLQTWYLVNSWKDLYVDNFVPFDFLDGIFVWTDHMKRDYLFHMPYLKEETIHVTGNPSFDNIIRWTPGHSREYYANKYKISLNAAWVYYTMMPPGLVNDEFDTVLLVAREMLKVWTAEEKVILLRRNPNHDKNDFTDLDLPPNVVLTDHYTTYDSALDMIVQSPDGEVEWVDLLNYSSLNLSVPSTVTLEFLVKNKPVINIGFAPSGAPDPRVRQHFEAGFYKPLFNDKGVLMCMTVSEVNKKIVEAENVLMHNNEFSDQASSKIVAILSEHLNKSKPTII